MYENRRSSGDKRHREKTVKNNTAFLQTNGRNKENIYKNDGARTWNINCRDRELYDNGRSRNCDRRVNE